MSVIVAGYAKIDTAEEAARHAFSLAEALGATIYLVSAVEDDASEVIEVGTDRYEIDMLSRARTEIEAFVAAVDSPATTNVIVERGDPAKVLVGVAEQVDADIIVIGNARMQGLTRFLGSIGSAVVQNAKCNVYVVKTT